MFESDVPIPVHMFAFAEPATHPESNGAGSISETAIAFAISCKDATRFASRLFVRALLRETSTIEAKIPMIAITTKSSMSVKPLVSDLRIEMLFMISLRLIINKAADTHKYNRITPLEEEPVWIRSGPRAYILVVEL